MLLFSLPITKYSKFHFGVLSLKIGKVAEPRAVAANISTGPNPKITAFKLSHLTVICDFFLSFNILFIQYSI